MSGHNLQADSSFNSVANAAPVSVQALSVQCHYSSGTDVGRDSLETTDNRVLDIMCLKWDEWSYPHLLLPWGLSNPRRAEPCFVGKKRVSGRLGKPGVKSRRHAQNPYWMSEGKHLQQPIMPYHPTLASSSVHLSSHQSTALFLSYYNVTQMTISA